MAWWARNCKPFCFWHKFNTCEDSWTFFKTFFQREFCTKWNVYCTVYNTMSSYTYCEQPCQPCVRVLRRKVTESWKEWRLSVYASSLCRDLFGKKYLQTVQISSQILPLIRCRFGYASLSNSVLIAFSDVCVSVAFRSTANRANVSIWGSCSDRDFSTMVQSI